MRFTRSPRRVSRHAISRRQVLRQLGAVAGAATFGPWIAGCGDNDARRRLTPTATFPPSPTPTQTATPTVTATATPMPLAPEELDIETVVLVMMENRSFDHYFGALSLEEGRAVNGLSAGFTNPDMSGALIHPFLTDLHCIADPPHGWDSSHAQVNGGLNDGFVREYHRSLVGDGFDPVTAPQVMGYQNRSRLPILYSLADEFTLCEQWFAALLGPTWPNRMYFHSAQSGGRNNNDVPMPLRIGFTWPTIYDRVGDAGLEWRSYFSDLPFLQLWGHLRRQSTKFSPIDAFFDDARSGRLPPLVSVEPTFLGPHGNDDHPPRDFARGEAFLSTVLHALADGPQWSRSLVIITYDEHGGFFDHVAPPVVDDERSDMGFGQLGVRVPGIVLSPYSKRGFVSSALYEHSSVSAFIGWLFGLEPLTVRDAEANFFLDSFDLDRIRRQDPRPFPTLPVIDLDPDVPPECPELNGLAADAELAAYADAGGIPPEFDYRADSADRLRRINRELVQLGGGRFRRRGK